jgi:hypothetical protein
MGREGAGPDSHFPAGWTAVLSEQDNDHGGESVGEEETNCGCHEDRLEVASSLPCQSLKMGLHSFSHENS